MRELPITFEKIWIKLEKDDLIIKMKKQIRFKEKIKKWISLAVTHFHYAMILMYAERIVMPALLQKCMLKEFYVGHPEISWMKSLMRCYIYWPKMDQGIEDLIKSCRGCTLAVQTLHGCICLLKYHEHEISWNKLLEKKMNKYWLLSNKMIHILNYFICLLIIIVHFFIVMVCFFNEIIQYREVPVV